MLIAPGLAALAAAPAGAAAASQGAFQQAELVRAPGYGQGGASIGLDDKGNGLAVWSELDVSNLPIIMASRFLPGTGWGAASVIVNASPDWASEPKLAVNGE